MRGQGQGGESSQPDFNPPHQLKFTSTDNISSFFLNRYQGVCGPLRIRCHCGCVGVSPGLGLALPQRVFQRSEISEQIR